MYFKSICFLINGLILLSRANLFDNKIEQCHLPEKLVREIASYQDTVNKIAECITNGPCKGSTYQHLATFVDTFSNRLTGTKNLENSIDYMLNESRKHGLDNVHGEEVKVPHWIRGNESAYMIKPRLQKLEMLSFGSSVGTPPAGITAEALVVDTFEELDAVAGRVEGKIVVFNEKFVSYGKTVVYRQQAAAKAAKYGALATLVRAITPFSMNTPHTGWQDYEAGTKKIPTASITAEDAHMLRRMQNRGTKITICLRMEARTVDDGAVSRNVIAEINGTQMPEKVVVVSGHIDSWDVGQGAMDDGAGFMMSWNSLAVLKQLNLRPRRTLRAIMWTAEEVGLVGALKYFQDHESELDSFNVMMESDVGTFAPEGLTFGGVDEAACIVQEILKHFSFLNATSLTRSDDVSSDITYFQDRGVPAVSLSNRNENYFWFHHSAADTLDVESAATLDANTILWASTAYIFADLSVDMPRK